MAYKYVQLIEYTLKNPRFVPKDACQECGLSEKEFEFIAPSLYSLSGYQGEHIRTKELQEWILLPESYFGYLQYLEFRHAIETAKRAYWLSVCAVIVAIITAGIAL